MVEKCGAFTQTTLGPRAESRVPNLHFTKAPNDEILCYFHVGIRVTLIYVQHEIIHACLERGLIHRDRVMQLMKQALNLQATTAGLITKFFYNLVFQNRLSDQALHERHCC